MFDTTITSDPYPAYARLHESAAIHWSDTFVGGAWLLPRYENVAAALRDGRLSSRRVHLITGRYGAQARAELAGFESTFTRTLLFLDATEHAGLRRLMDCGFKPSVLEAARPRIARIAHELLDRVASRGETDFMADFAHPLPALVIADLLGVDPGRQREFIAWSDDIAALIGNPQASMETAYRAQTSTDKLIEYFRSVLPERRERPGDDLISLLIRVEEDAQLIDEESLLAQCVILLFGGHETTRNLLGNGLLALLPHGSWHQLAADRSLMAGALKEILRYDSPLQFVTRVATEDFVLQGREIRQGQRLAMLIGAANRDPARFSDPDRFDIRRREGPHLAFGHGPHACIGAALSTIEGDVAFNALMDRLPGLRLSAAAPQWSPNPAFRGLARLPVVFPPAAERGSSHSTAMTN